MTEQQQREAARQFYYKWNGKGREDEDARSYWIDIIQDVLGADRVTDRLDFEKKVIGADGNTKRIDVYIPETHTLTLFPGCIYNYTLSKYKGLKDANPLAFCC